MTYKTFTAANKIIPLIRKAYADLMITLTIDNERQSTVENVAKFLTTWVRDCYTDFQFDMPVIDEIFLFIAQLGNDFSSPMVLDLAQTFGLLVRCFL